MSDQQNGENFTLSLEALREATALLVEDLNWREKLAADDPYYECATY